MKNLVLSSLKDYTLIARVREDNTVYEYVVAYCYDSKTDSWQQGHYFSDLRKAVSFMELKKLSKESKRAKLIELMHEYLQYEVDDEEAYMSWINLVPDEPNSEDFEFIANDIDEWKDCVRLFGSLVKNYDE